MVSLRMASATRVEVSQPLLTKFRSCFRGVLDWSRHWRWARRSCRKKRLEVVRGEVEAAM